MTAPLEKVVKDIDCYHRLYMGLPHEPVQPCSRACPMSGPAEGRRGARRIRTEGGRPPAPPTTGPVDRGELSAYLAAATAELAGLAHAGGFRTLGFLTDLARMEAERLAATFVRQPAPAGDDQASETRPPGSR